MMLYNQPSLCVDDQLQATAGSLRSQLTAEDAYSGVALEDDRAVADEDRPRVHSGFLRSLMQSGLYLGVHDALRTLPARPGSAPQRLFVTGHSLGAAMAALAAPMLLRDFQPPEIRLYTFGAPRTGNQVCCCEHAIYHLVQQAVSGTHACMIQSPAPAVDG